MYLLFALGKMAIDFETVKNLELVRDSQTGSQKRNSLYAIMNQTSTAVGARLLKANIVQPPTDEATINMRLDAIESILDNEENFFSAAEMLSRLTNLDTLINTLVATPKRSSPGHTKSCIRTVISLQHVLALVSQIGECIAGFRNSGACLPISNYVRSSRFAIQQCDLCILPVSVVRRRCIVANTKQNC